MNPKWELYKQLELIPDSEPKPEAPQLTVMVWLDKFWQFLMNASAQKQEPQIWKRMDQSGNVWWDTYDPATGQVMYFASADEIRRWLDQLPYYHKL
ncbi:MAG: hypothetical protein WCA35_26950 [Kovacikia sp.]